MSVSSTTCRAAFSGDGSTTAFAFPYFFLAKSDIVVKSVSSTGVVTAKAITTDYTIAGTAAANGTYPSGGTITMLSAPASGTTLTIARDVPHTQATTWVDNDPDPAAVKELAFDKLTLEVQRLFDLLRAAPTTSDGFHSTFTGGLPALLPANSYLIVNPAGTGWLMTTTPPAGYVTGTESSGTSIVAGTGVVPAANALDQTVFVKGTGGVIVTANPQIAAGDTIGQKLTLIGTSDMDTVTLADGTGLSQNGPITLANRNSIDYRWTGTVWSETARREN